ncbi:MAG: sigma-70 family RNA polymerase sigma factor [Clostridia bacterium]|nr:sigma-70 family RNA polymerase sigma factor [Clostridia bacterium]
MNTPTACYQQLVEQNLGLVHTCCHRLQGKGIDYDDLYGAGCLGLCKAAQGFDRERGVCFSTYAVPVILGEIRRLFRDGGSIKISRTIKERMMQINRITPTLTEQLGRQPTVGELADALSLTREQVTEAVCAARPVLSLTVTTDEEEDGQWDLPVDSCEDALCEQDALQTGYQTLCETDRELIRLRYFEGKTQTVTAGILGMTQVQVSHRERKILQDLRRILT